MAILRFPISPSEPCIFAIFEPKNFKFWILIENHITTNIISGFFDKFSISSGNELELGPSRIKVFFLFSPPFCFVCSNFFLMISNSKIYHYIQSKLNIKMWWNEIMWWYNKKKPLIREGPNSSSIAEIIEILSKNPNVSFVVK
jgi:hypothetical protein